MDISQMNRRGALKFIALACGVTVSYSGVAQSLKAVASTPNVSGKGFFNDTEKAVLQALSEIILPSIPEVSYEDIKPHLFIDAIYSSLMDDREKARFQKGMAVFLSQAETQENKSFLSLGEKQEDFVSAFYRLSPEEEDKVLWQIDGNNPAPELNDQYYLYAFLFNVRKLSIEAFINSQKVGEQLLAYDQVPGVYEDITITEDTKAWSLR